GVAATPGRAGVRRALARRTRCPRRGPGPAQPAGDHRRLVDPARHPAAVAGRLRGPGRRGVDRAAVPAAPPADGAPEAHPPYPGPHRRPADRHALTAARRPPPARGMPAARAPPCYTETGQATPVPSPVSV